MRPILLLFFIFFNPKLFFLFCSSFTFFPNGKKKKSLRERERGGKTEKVLKFETDKPIIAFSSFYSVLLKTHSPTKPPAQSEDIWKNIITFGWTVRSPEGNNQVDQLDLSEDLITSIVLGDAYLATGDHVNELTMLNRYFKQHRYIKVKWAREGPIVYNDTGLGIWTVESFELIPLVD
jgi:hypothetical protein